MRAAQDLSCTPLGTRFRSLRDITSSCACDWASGTPQVLEGLEHASCLSSALLQPDDCNRAAGPTKTAVAFTRKRSKVSMQSRARVRDLTAQTKL
ncbi:hypothetical protein M3J09_010593 [Ascochyta lentis]